LAEDGALEVRFVFRTLLEWLNIFLFLIISKLVIKMVKDINWLNWIMYKKVFLGSVLNICFEYKKDKIDIINIKIINFVII
jgi:hypothetical protein